MGDMYHIMAFQINFIIYIIILVVVVVCVIVVTVIIMICKLHSQYNVVNPPTKFLLCCYNQYVSHDEYIILLFVVVVT